MFLAVSSVLELLDQLLLELEHVNKTRYIKLSKRSKIQTVGYPSKKNTCSKNYGQWHTSAQPKQSNMNQKCVNPGLTHVKCRCSDVLISFP